MSPIYLFLAIVWTLGFCAFTSWDEHLRQIDGRIPPSEEHCNGAALLWLIVFCVILIGGCTA